MPSWITQISPQINLVWRGRWKAGDIEPARVLYDHELVVITEGRCTIRVGEREHELTAGDFLIVPPETLHVTTAGEGGVYRWCVHFDWVPTRRKVLRPYYCFYPRKPVASRIVTAPAFVPPSAFRGSWQTEGVIPGLLETLFHRWQTGEPLAQATCRGTLIELLTHLTWPRQDSSNDDVRKDARRGRERTREDRARQLAHSVKDLLDCDEMPPFAGMVEQLRRGGRGRRAATKTEGSIQARLASLGFSYPHLCRLFRLTFGVTPVEYRTARRLEYAKTLLRTRKFTVAEVAAAAGFEDAGYFARKFRQQNGVTPSTFG
ncbi:AraC family transcriptional regulator [Opitutaceae bacterium TAV4]|nr:AraC family transcriptional regulator [Opitutaceae bacterium TAV4]RRJ97292.1 AraC family transcriptional regulator [Opitutaceae bacterium TAV4]RRJ99393.1 AraC family transcriptional regulator [Opitutaceae bacterium TAV3]